MRYLLYFCILLASTHTIAVTLVKNANGYSFNNQGELIRFSTLVFKQGKVVALGDDGLASEYKQADIIDAQGNTLLPGLIDAHGHMLGLGKNLLQVDLRGTQSAKAAVQAVDKYAKKHPDLPWIQGRGWNQVLWPDKAYPTRQQLDIAFPDTPVWLRRVDGHAGWANSKALAIAGITDDTPNPSGGEIVKDAKGQPTGILIDNAMSLLEAQIPQDDSALLQQRLSLAGKHLLSLGITSMHDAGIDHDTYHLYLARAAEKALPVRIYAMLSVADPHFDTMLERGPIEADKLSIRSVKVYGDGALGSRGAALLQEYTDSPGHHGLLVTPESQLKSVFDKVIGANFQLNYHAIGDKANRLALDQFADTFSRLGRGQGLRNRIEHAQVIEVADIPRYKAIGIIPSMQPVHAVSDMNMAQDRVGEKRLTGAYAWRTFLNQGSKLAFGSDFPVELANPFHGLHAAVTRQSRENQPATGWRAQESLTIEEAFKAFTLDAAYAAHQETLLGGLTAGKWADFILVDKDIFAVPAQEIWQTQVLATYLAGDKVFLAPN